jgi:predicted Zn-dependent peptidase
MKKYFLFLKLVIAIQLVSAQNKSAPSKNYEILMAKNGLNSICVYAPQLPMSEVELIIRAGSIHERNEQKGLAGLLCQLFSNKMKNTLNAGKYPSIRFSAVSGIENTVFRFTSPHQELSSLLEFIYKHLVNQKIDESEIKKAIEDVSKNREEYQTAPQYAYRRIQQQQLFKFDSDKITIWADSATLLRYTVLEVDSFYRLYYSPVATTITVYSNTTPFTIQSLLEKTFNSWSRTDFNPDEFTKIRSIKPVIYTTQNTIVQSAEQPKITLSFLTTGSRNYTRGCYYSYLLSSMLNDTTLPFFKELKTETGNPPILATYEINNYYGIFTLSVFPTPGYHELTYKMLLKSLSEWHLHINDTTVAAAKKKFAIEYFAFKGTPGFFAQSARHIYYNNTDFFETLNDSIQCIHTRQFLRHVYTSFCNANFAVIALTDSATYESENYRQWLADIDESIANEKFTFRKNVCEIEGDANLQLLNRLIQWLKVNPDIQCQINGKADKKEYDKFKDPAVWFFIDTIETFKKYKPDLLKTGIMRPELLRSLKVLKALAESGIELDRLSGTAIPLSSRTKEEEAEHRVATLSLTRLKSRLPLRDIRIFGK